MTFDPYMPPAIGCPWCPWLLRSTLYPVPTPVAEKMLQALDHHIGTHADQLHQEITAELSRGQA